jgi:uncharacterized SAM-binding protein YcdF (DUF218 family)
VANENYIAVCALSWCVSVPGDFVRRWVLKLFSVLIILIVALYAAQVLEVYLYSKNNTIDRADAVIVLGAAAWGNNPSPVFRERLNHAIDLYQGGYCRYIIITGGKGYPDELGESVIGKKYVMKNGVPESDIIIENYSRSTEQNLHYAQIIATYHDIKSYILVSDPYHLRRAAYVADRYGMKVYLSATPTSRYKSGEQKMSFLLKEGYYMILYRLESLMGIQLD